MDMRSPCDKNMWMHPSFCNKQGPLHSSRVWQCIVSCCEMLTTYAVTSHNRFDTIRTQPVRFRKDTESTVGSVACRQQLNFMIGHSLVLTSWFPSFSDYREHNIYLDKARLCTEVEVCPQRVKIRESCLLRSISKTLIILSRRDRHNTKLLIALIGAGL